MILTIDSQFPTKISEYRHWIVTNLPIKIVSLNQHIQRDLLMLSLTRRPNESITLYTSDGVIEIQLSDIRGNQARIGIDAPKSIKIVRSEIDTPQPQNSFTLMGLLSLCSNK